MAEKRRVITGTNAVAVVVISAIVAILLNVVVAGIPMPIDLTENQIYTLSQASKDTVKNLPEPVEVKVFISPGLPAPLNNLPQQISDLLADYQSASGGKLTYQIIQPAADDKDAEAAATGFGIQKVGLGSQSEDEVSLRAVYKGVAFVMGDKTERIADLRATGNPEYDNFEYEFTKKLMNLSNTKPRKLAFAAGFGGPAGSPQFLDAVRPAFEQLYGNLIELSSIDLSAADASVPEDIDALVLLNLEQPVSDRGKFAIDQFIQRGGSVGWYQSASGPDRQMIQQIMQQMGPNGPMPDIRKPLDHGLGELFKNYGIQLNSDLLLDRKNALAFGVIMTQNGLARVSHPATFLMSDIDRTLPFTRDVYSIAMPGPSSVVLTPAIKDNKDVKAFEIIKTAATAVKRDSPPTSLNYQELVEPTATEIPGPFVVAAALQGRVPSWYANNPLPAGVTEDQLVKEQAEARILVVGNADFLQPNPQVGFDEQLTGLGGQFFISSIEWLVQDNALTGIRGKVVPRLIGEVTKDQQREIQIINILFVPIFFGTVGWTILAFRRRRKKTLTV
ncbi:MAG: GldG family protein [bacterium]